MASKNFQIIFCLLLLFPLIFQTGCVKQNLIQKNLAYEFFLIGFRYENNKKYEMAYHAYKEAVRYDSESSYLHYRLAKVAQSLTMYKEAKKSIKNAIRLEPRSDYYLFLGKLYVVMSRETPSGKERKIRKYYNSAAENFKKCVALDPHNQDALLSLGLIYEITKQSTLAIQCYEKLIEKKSFRDHSLIEKVIHLYVKERSFDRAEDLYRKVLAYTSYSTFAIRGIGELYVIKKEYKRAVEWYLSNIPSDRSGQVEIRSKLAGLYLKLKDTDRAIGEYLQLTKLSGDTKYWRMLGVLYYKQEEYEKAKECFTIVLERVNDFEAHYYLGSIFLDQKVFNRAIEEFGRCIEIDKEHYGSHLNMVLAKISNKNYKAALGRLENISELFPKRTKVYYLMGICYNQLKERKQAIRSLEKAMQIDTSDLAILFELGALYERNQEYKKAVSVFKRIILLDPDHASALNYLAYMWAERGENLDTAKIYLERALKKEPRNGAFLDSYAWTFFQMKDYKKARYYLQEALKYVKDDAIVYEHLARTHECLGNSEEAVKYWEKVLEFDPENKNALERLQK
jgi:tetratricopeptide (TPR) repeat protein